MNARSPRTTKAATPWWRRHCGTPPRSPRSPSGRVAEELVFHDPSTGASNDIEKATGIARKMVTEFGMSERVGAVRLGQGGGEPFLGRDAGHERNYSDQIAYIVDEE